MTETPTVAVIAPGNMGAAVAKRLTEHKVTVLTVLDGRSEASEKRAQDAGMQAVDERKLAEAAFRPVIFYPAGASCRQPWLKGWTRMTNSIYNEWRFEDVWLDK